MASPSPPADFHPSRRLYLAFLSLAVLTLMVALDGTSISVALPTIATALHGTTIEAFWSGTAFLLCNTVFQPTFASLGYIFGRKQMTLVALSFFLAEALIAALARGFTLLLVGRSVQGVGGGGLVAITEIVLTDLVPLSKRGTYTGVIGSMYAIGGAAGPIIGGAFAQVGWRWIFWINVPFVAVSAVLIYCFLRLNFKQTSLLEKLRRVDWIGMVLFVGSAIAILIPMSWGGVMYAWSSWRTLVPLAVGGAGVGVFFSYENLWAREPLISSTIFPNRTANIGYLTTVLQGLILWCVLYFLPLYLEAVHDYSSIIAGVALFPATFTAAPSAIAAGLLMTKRKAFRWAVWLGWILTTLGLGLLLLLGITTSIPQWIFIIGVSGVGLGILSPALGLQVQAAQVDQRSVGFAIALWGFFRAIGQTIGIATGGVIFQNQLVKKLSADPRFAARAAELGKDAARLVSVIKEMPDGPEKLALKMAYVDSLRTVWIVACALAGMALVVSVFVVGHSLDVGLSTEQGLLEGEDGSGKYIALEEGS